MTSPPEPPDSPDSPDLYAALVSLLEDAILTTGPRRDDHHLEPVGDAGCTATRPTR